MFGFCIGEAVVEHGRVPPWPLALNPQNESRPRGQPRLGARAGGLGTLFEDECGRQTPIQTPIHLRCDASFTVKGTN